MDARAVSARAAALPVVAALLCAGAPARAQDMHAIDVAAGRLSEAVPRLAAQAGISISVANAQLWRVRGRSVRGTYTAGQALVQLLQGTGSHAVRLSPTGWRIEPDPPRPRRSAASAAAQAGTALEPGAEAEIAIIVTASKLDQNDREMATVAHVIGGTDLTFSGENGTDAILSRLASVTSTHLGSGRNKLFIRGMADSSFTGPTQSTVGEYLGDLRLSYNAPDPDLRLYDIDRVEILEGSQGTLYGAGSLSGIIRLVPNEPDPRAFALSASMGASLVQHGKPGGDIAATMNLPLSEHGHALRVTGYGVSEGGYIDNPRRQERDGNQTRIFGGRATLRLDPGDGWTVDLGGIYQATRIDDAQYAERGGPPLSRASSVVQAAQAHYGMAMLVLSKDWGSVRFQTSNAYVNHALAERFDAAPHGTAPNIFNQRNRTSMLTSETRLWRPVRDGWGWLIGFSALGNRTELHRDFEQRASQLARTGVRNEISEFTGYGKLSVEPFRGLVLSGGGRVTHSRLGGGGLDIQPALIAAGMAITAQRTESQLLPSADALLHLNQSLSLFARYEESFRPGGLAVEGDFVRRFRNDRVSNWEVGARWGSPGAAMAATLSFARTNWRDIQADFIDAGGLPSTANIGTGRITSIAATVTLRPAPGLRVNLSAVHNHSRVTALTPEVAALAASSEIGLPSTGKGAAFPLFGELGGFGATARIGKIPNVADQAAQGSIDYLAPLGGRELHVGAWVKYVGPSRLGIGPRLGDEQGDYVDTGLAARLGNASRGITLTLTNLFDAKGNRFALGSPFDTESGGFVTPQRPRTVHISADFAL